MLLIGIRKEARSHVLHLSRSKRYTLTPEQLKWDQFKLTYKYVSDDLSPVLIPGEMQTINSWGKTLVKFAEESLRSTTGLLVL